MANGKFKGKKIEKSWWAVDNFGDGGIATERVPIYSYKLQIFYKFTNINLTFPLDKGD